MRRSYGKKSYGKRKSYSKKRSGKRLGGYGPSRGGIRL